MSLNSIKISCSCGHTRLWRKSHIEYGEDTIVTQNFCNGISCDYYGCPGGEKCWAHIENEPGKIKYARVFVRYTCPACDCSADRVLSSEPLNG